ncbi:hypothetical protein M0R45_008514 [Rubus argutus]|uniref:Uncharacterized protein n=1 Tax=Rubus argutus TaxID=59490 RepID=A0AAW1Y4B0_RUBAR
MNPPCNAALDSDVVFHNDYEELVHSKTRQLLYNMAIDITRNNPDMSFEQKSLTTEIQVNEGVLMYAEAKWILTNLENFRILQEEALANGMLKYSDFTPPEYPYMAQSLGSITPSKRKNFSYTEGATSSLGHKRFKTKPYMSVRPQPTIPLGFMPTPGMNLEMEDSTSYDPEEMGEEESSKK